MFTRCNFVLVIVTPSDTYLREQVAYQSVFDCSFQEKHVFIGTFEYLKLTYTVGMYSRRISNNKYSDINQKRRLVVEVFCNFSQMK